MGTWKLARPRPKGTNMRTGGIGGSLVLIALGAILFWAVNAEAEGFNINMVGLILLIVGAIGLVLTLIMSASTQATDENDVTIIERCLHDDRAAG